MRIYARIMRNDIAGKLGAMVVVFAFIFLSALLVAAGSSLIVELNSGLNRLFSEAEAPHFVQMHAGELDTEAIEQWATGQELVARTQIAEMITVDGSALYLPAEAPGTEAPEENSVMDLSFVVQNEDFDFLLDSENRIADVSPGDIGIPVYYAEERGLAPGDTVTVDTGTFVRTYTVSTVIRDAQMNPAIVHSKRFLVHPSDYAELRRGLSETEHLVEFRLTDPDRVDEIAAAYADAGLPARGPAVDHRLFKLLNGLSDGIVAAVVIILSLMLMVIAILCLRFTILATIEEDYREIGVMKAVGMPRGRIMGIYLLKYVALAGGAALAGYLAARPLDSVLTENITVYIGRGAPGPAHLLVPALATLAVFFLVILSALVVLRRFNRISAVEALREGARREAPRPGRTLALSRAGVLNVNVFLGLRDAVQRFRLFGLLTFVFFFAAAVTLIPLHFLSTMRSPEFITYMGVGRSDIRIDLRQTEDAAAQLERITTRLDEDREVARFAPLVTSQFTLLRENGETEAFPVETGDFTLFPLDYLRGRAPAAQHEIALSYLNGRELEKSIGDRLRIEGESGVHELEVVGIYQDITDGGRTAKAGLPHDPENILALTVGLDVRSGIQATAKVRELQNAFPGARVTVLDSYLSQTLGSTVGQLRRVTVGAVAVGLCIAMLITALFLRMLVRKDARRIAVMTGLGFPVRGIRVQYLTTALLLLVFGIGAGSIFSNTAGQRLVSFLWGFMGAGHIEFVIEPLSAYVLMPALLMGAVALTTLASIRGITDRNLPATIAE